MEEHHGGFRDFDDESRSSVLRAAFFYIGESFVGEVGRELEWSVGRDDRVEYQQPVVTGFRTDADLPALVVAENIFLGAASPDFNSQVATAVDIWTKAI